MKKQVEIKNISKEKAVVISPEMERRMRIIVNLIIDRIFEDREKKALKVKSASNENGQQWIAE